LRMAAGRLAPSLAAHAFDGQKGPNLLSSILRWLWCQSRSERLLNMLKYPPPIWALIFLILTAGASYLGGWPTVPQLHNPTIGIGLIVVSFIAPVWALILFRRAGTQLNTTSEINNKLVTGGPFRFTRNPMYLGLVVLCLGVAVATGAVLIFAAPFLVFATVNWVHIPFEEAKMRRLFGPAFDDYVRNVRRWL